ncbi:MAG: inositol monophosphatase family protein [Bdellovibrionota bacterium]
MTLKDMHMVDGDEIVSVAKEAALKAGEFAASVRNRGAFEIQFKEGNQRNLLTEADLGAEKIILEIVRSRFPDHTILAEESSPVFEQAEDYLGPLWIIDPIDGTTNFAHAHHHVGVSIAFADRGVAQAAVVHAPFLGETFTAVRGKGAFRNGDPISVSGRTSLESALIGTGFPYGRESADEIARRLANVLRNCRDVRRAGAASLDLCWVACGRLDGFYEPLAPWDIAAGLLIAREAGARIGRYSDANRDSALPDELDGNDLCLATPAIYEDLEKILRSA